MITVYTDNGESYYGETVDDVVRHMSSDLDAGGPRTIYAAGHGYEARVSLEAGVTEYAKAGDQIVWSNDKD